MEDVLKLIESGKSSEEIYALTGISGEDIDHLTTEWFTKNIIGLIAAFYDVSQPNAQSKHTYKVVGSPVGNVTIYAKSRKIQTANGWITDGGAEWLKKNVIQCS